MHLVLLHRKEREREREREHIGGVRQDDIVKKAEEMEKQNTARDLRHQKQKP